MLQTVDPQYSAWPALVGLLVKLDVIKMGQRKHSFSHVVSLMQSSQPRIQGHWIPLAVVSMKQEYIEIIPIGK